MVSAKLYTYKDEVSKVINEMKDFGIFIEKQQSQEYYICKAFDSSNQNKLYIVYEMKDSEVLIQKTNQKKSEEYLLDCCIRMIVHHLFQCEHKKIIFTFDEQDVFLQEVCLKIGFTLIEKSGKYKKIGIAEEQFYKNNC